MVKPNFRDELKRLGLPTSITGSITHLTNQEKEIFERGVRPNANLRGANLSGVNFGHREFYDASFRGSILAGADFTGSRLVGVDFTIANLRNANFTSAYVSRCSFVGANLSGAIGLLNASDWMEQNFGADSKGYVVYKIFGLTPYSSIIPDSWRRIPGAFLAEVVCRDRTSDCGCGVNFGTREWCYRFGYGRQPELWRCRIRWRDLPGVVVPYGTDGKARCERLELLDVVKTVDWEKTYLQGDNYGRQ